jgi:lipopolysaccharide/colanic/teichoic acid biosynthesis glycosyltransferase
MVRGLQASTSMPERWEPPISPVPSPGIAVGPETATIAPVIPLRPRRATAIRRRSLPSRGAKRAFDVAFAFAVSAVTAPIVGAAIVAIRIESPGPALFRQRRMGLDGSTFELIKLRGMYVDARERFPELYDYASMTIDGQEPYYFHHERDPRVTRVGRLLRRYSIDELPNFWNVLRGDMSVVGPRPIRPAFFEELCEQIPQYWQRLVVDPGMTGFAQLRMTRETSWSEKLAHDLEYIADRSVALYLRVVAATAWRVLTSPFRALAGIASR